MVGGFFTYQCSQNFVEQKEHFLSGVNESEAIWLLCRVLLKLLSPCSHSSGCR